MLKTYENKFDFDSLQVGSVKVPINTLVSHILDAENVTVQDIFDEPNTEIRMVLIELYGLTRFMADADAKILDSHPKYGDYISVDLAPGNTMFAVLVTNRTPEPNWETLTEEQRKAKVMDGMCTEDGYKRYVLFIPHGEFNNVKAAVAWTFGLSELEYDPDVES